MPYYPNQVLVASLFVIELTTLRTVIRNFRPDDWPDLRDIILDKETSPYALYEHPFPAGEQDILPYG